MAVDQVAGKSHRQPVVVVLDGVPDGRRAAHACSAAFTVGLDALSVVGVDEPAPLEAPGVGNVTPWSVRQLR
jgi:hypothetical protein